MSSPFAHYCLYALASCFRKHIDVRDGVVTALPFPSAEASEEHGVVNPS